MIRRLAPLVVVACAGTSTPESAPVEPASVEATPVEPIAVSAALPDVPPVAPTEALPSPYATPADASVAAARERLHGIVMAHARDPNNPWAIGHGLLALGPDVVLTNDVSAIDHLFSAYAETLDVQGQTVLRFPMSRGDVRIEPHSDLVLKAITEVGIAPDHIVTVQGAQYPVADLWRGSLERAWVSETETGFVSWNDTPWALQGIATWAPNDLTWTAAGGHEMTLDAYTSHTVATLRRETAFLREAIAAGRPVQKQGQHIFEYTCGGAHLFQGAAYAVGRGYGTPADRDAIAEELGVYFWRASIELAQVDGLLESNPEYAPILLEQRLKFTGHLLETAHKVWALGITTPSEEDLVFIDVLRTQVAATVQAIDALGVWDRLADVRASNEQVYLDYVGDAAHALRGLDLSTGQGVVRR